MLPSSPLFVEGSTTANIGLMGSNPDSVFRMGSELLAEVLCMDSDQRMISVMFASSRAMVRELYVQAFKGSLDIRVIGCASSGVEIPSALNANPIDIALITAGLLDGPYSGILAVQSLRASHPHVKPVILLEQAEVQLVTVAFRAGAKGVFFPEQDGFEMLCRCVRKVQDGQVWASSTHLHELLEVVARPVAGRIVSSSGVRLLTNREEDILRLVEDGLTNRQIAQELNLSEHTVRNNLFRIFDKLGVSTRVELALYSVNRANSLSFPATRNIVDTDAAPLRPRLLKTASIA